MDDLALPGMPDAPEPAPLDPDPAPGKRGRGRPRKTAAAPAAASTPTRRQSTPRASKPRTATSAATVAAIRDELELYLLMAAGAGSMRCPSCGSVAEEQVPKLADKLAAIIARNPALVAKFSTGTLLADIFGVIMAALPIVKAVYSHHGPGAHDHAGEVTADADPYSRYGAYAPAGAMG